MILTMTVLVNQSGLFEIHAIATQLQMVEMILSGRASNPLPFHRKVAVLWIVLSV